MLNFPGVDHINVVVVGDVMLDKYWLGKVDRISPEAPIPIIAIESAESEPGGAANVASNAAVIGANTTLYGIVGEDAAGRELETLLESHGITCNLVRQQGYSTIEKHRFVARNQQILRADFEVTPPPEAAQTLRDKTLLALPSADVLVISDYAKGSLTKTAGLINKARESGVPTIVDPKGDEFERYRGATLLTPNEGEFQAVVGRWRDADDMAQRASSLIAALDIDALIVTRSEKGIAMFRRDGTVVESPARAREVFDVSGAGDTVVAVIASTLSVVQSDEDRLALANAAAAVVVARQGTARVTRQEIDESIRRSVL